MAPRGVGGNKAGSEQLLKSCGLPSPENLGVTDKEKCHQLSKGLIAKLSGRARTRLSVTSTDW